MNRSAIRNSISALIIVAGVFMSSGCDRLPNSWEHYANGGHYPATSLATGQSNNSVYFSSPRTGHGDIYLATIGKGSLENWVQVTNDERFESHPVVSPSGTLLAFSREDSTGTHVWTCRPDGSDKKKITFGATNSYAMEISGDDSMIAVSQSKADPGGGASAATFVVSAKDGSVLLGPLNGHVISFDAGNEVVYDDFDSNLGKYRVWKVELPDGEREPIAFGRSPVLSPDGQMLSVATEEKVSRMLRKYHILDRTGNLLLEVDSESLPVFTHDSEGVLYITNEQWVRKMWWAKCNGTKKKMLYKNGGVIGRPVTSTTGFVFLSFEQGDRVPAVYRGSGEGAVVRLGSVDGAEN